MSDMVYESEDLGCRQNVQLRSFNLQYLYMVVHQPLTEDGTEKNVKEKGSLEVDKANLQFLYRR